MTNGRQPETTEPARWSWTVLVVPALATLAGLTVAVTLSVESIPSGPGAPGTVTTKTHSSKTTCSKQCRNPETTETKVTVTTTPPDDEGSDSVFDKAIDNDAGVRLLRFAIALLAALLVGLLARRAMRGIRRRAVIRHSLPAEIAKNQLELISLTAEASPSFREALMRAKEAGAIHEGSAGEDPHAALAELLNGVVEVVRELARIGKVDEGLSIEQMLAALSSREVIFGHVKTAILGLIEVGDRAASGAQIDSGAAEWIRVEGPRLLAGLRVLAEEPRR